MNVDLSAIAMVAIFIIGYLAIAFEHSLGINKAASAIGMAALLWGFQLAGAADLHETIHNLAEHLADTSQIIFFLLGAMTLVEVIDAHGAFGVVTNQITTKNPKKLIVVIGLLAFFMSSVLDNLTTTIVMVSLLRRMILDREERLMMGSFVVVAANTGGAWTPIGDVTTTMLWIGGQISSVGVIHALLIPCLLSLAATTLYFTWTYRPPESDRNSQFDVTTPQMVNGARRVLGLGLLSFLLVPILKGTLHMPPFLGICVGLSAMWILTDILHRRSDNDHVRVPQALSRVDVSSAFFFLGILLAVGALESHGLLRQLAASISSVTQSEGLIAATIGVASSIVDNVPLVAASMNMYSLDQYPMDASFWDLIAFCAGTGGSLLIIGSAAGVALMGMEHITFGWYLKRATPMALVGFLVGLAAALVHATYFD